MLQADIDEDKKRKIKEIYDKAMAELDTLENEKKQSIHAYIKLLEDEKIAKIKEDLKNKFDKS